MDPFGGANIPGPSYSTPRTSGQTVGGATQPSTAPVIPIRVHATIPQDYIISAQGKADVAARFVEKIKTNLATVGNPLDAAELQAIDSLPECLRGELDSKAFSSAETLAGAKRCSSDAVAALCRACSLVQPDFQMHVAFLLRLAVLLHPTTPDEATNLPVPLPAAQLNASLAMADSDPPPPLTLLVMLMCTVSNLCSTLAGRQYLFGHGDGTASCPTKPLDLALHGMASDQLQQRVLAATLLYNVALAHTRKQADGSHRWEVDGCSSSGQDGGNTDGMPDLATQILCSAAEGLAEETVPDVRKYRLGAVLRVMRACGAMASSLASDIGLMEVFAQIASRSDATALDKEASAELAATIAGANQ